MIRVADFAAKFGSEDRAKLLTKVEKAAMDAALGDHAGDEEAHVSSEDRERWDGAGEGTVKSVSVNGGDPAEPDGGGNVDLGGIASQAMLVSAVSAEQTARQTGDAAVLDDAKDYTDLALADHALNTQFWLPSAAAHENLPDPAGIEDRAKTYLCRVYGENSVYQLRPPEPPDPDVWELYSQNDAYVPRTSTETAGGVIRNYSLLNNGGELAGSAETRDAGGTDQFTVFRQTGEAVTLEYLDSAAGAGKKVDYRGGILRYGGDTAAHEAAVKGDLAGLMDIDGAEWVDA